MSRAPEPVVPRASVVLQIVVLTVGYSLLAPLGMLLLPLAGVLLVGPDRTPERVIIGGVAGGIGLWWVIQVGTPPEQIARTAAITGAVGFVAASRLGGASVIHRSLLALLFAAGTVAASTAVSRSWTEVTWWLESRAAFMQAMLTQLWLAARPAGDGGSAAETAAQLEAMIARIPDVMVDFFPAILGLQLVAGLALATYAAQRVGFRVPGHPIGRFMDFRFSEHLGWVAVLGIGALLLTDARAVTVPVANLVLFAAVLYAWRGAAVAWYGIRHRPGNRWLIAATIVVSVLLIWPMVVATIIIGVVDTGLDFRRRWQPAR